MSMRKQRQAASEEERDGDRQEETERDKLKKKNKGQENKTHLLSSRLITADFWRDMNGIAH